CGNHSMRVLLASAQSGPLPDFVFFFFSSRRRHTRLVSDWSSDVCSSDLQDNVYCAAEPRYISGTTINVVLRRGWRCTSRSTDRQDRKSGVEGKSGDLGGRRGT